MWHPQYFVSKILRYRHTIQGTGHYRKEINCWFLYVILFILLSGRPLFGVSTGIEEVADTRVVFYNDW